MIAQLLRGPHSLYRRYQALLESVLTAAGFATVVALALNALGLYPYNWVVVMGMSVAVLGIRWPLAAYALAVALVVYPIYTINLYLAVIFFAVAALGHRLFTHYLGATSLVLATPILAQYHLHWLVPVMGGLWWGGLSGAWVGGLGALWGKILGGMTGLDIDWLAMAGQAPEMTALADRFSGANSLDTLLLLVDPFAAASNVVLYNLLQLLGWAAAGAFVGMLAWRRWVKYRLPWSILVVTAGGGLLMLVTHVGLPYWLTEAAPAALQTQDPVAPLFSLLVVIVVGTTIYTLRESLDLPVAPKRNIWSARRRARSQQGGGLPFLRRSTAKATAASEQPAGEAANDLSRPRQPVPVPHQSELPEWEPPQTDSGLIMLEID